MRRAVTTGLLPVLLATVIGLSYALTASPGTAQTCNSCESSCCNTCSEHNGDTCGTCCPYTLFTPLIGLARLLGAGCDPCGCQGCGHEVWIGEWRNRCCDPCDSCGNFTGGSGTRVSGAVMGTAAPVSGGCNCGGYSQRTNAPMANGYANQRPAAPTTYANQRPAAPTTYVNQRPAAPTTYANQRPQTRSNNSNYAARPTSTGYAPRSTPVVGDMVGQARIVSVTDEVVTPARTASTPVQTSRSR